MIKLQCFHFQGSELHLQQGCTLASVLRDRLTDSQNCVFIVIRMTNGQCLLMMWSFHVLSVIAQQYACRWLHAELTKQPPPARHSHTLSIWLPCGTVLTGEMHESESSFKECNLPHLIAVDVSSLVNMPPFCFILNQEVFHSVATCYRSFTLLLHVTGPSLCCYTLQSFTLLLHITGPSLCCYTLQVLHSVATCYRSFTLLLCVYRSFTLLLCTPGHSLCCYVIEVIHSVATW